MSCLELDDAAILKVAEPMIDDIVRGMAERDYAVHSRHFSVNLKSAITPETFRSACERQECDWGLPGMRQLVAIFRKQKSFTVVCHQEFNNTQDEILAVTTVALKGGRYFVDFFLLH